MPQPPRSRAARSPEEKRDLVEIGRLTIGDRCFAVVLSSDVRNYSAPAEISEFTLGDIQLAAFEIAAAEDTRDPISNGIVDRLTGRELEIAVLVAQGHATKNIAHKLQISEWTAATYLRRIFAKLNVYNRAEMVYRCSSLIRRTSDSEGWEYKMRTRY